MKIGDRFVRNGLRYVVVDVKQRVVKARRLVDGGAVGYNVLSFPKKVLEELKGQRIGSLNLWRKTRQR
jgi:predicted DNA-binding transcriptional regulator